MKKIYKHTTFLIFAISVTIFVIMIYAYMHYKISILVDGITAKREALLTAEYNENHEKEVLDIYKSTIAKWSRLPDYFVPSNRVVGFIEAIEAIGSKNGGTVSISSIDADNLEATTTGKLGKIRAHVGVGGSWPAVMGALKLAEVLPYQVSIDNVSFAVSTINSDEKIKEVKHGWKLSFDIVATEIATK
jgi:hypothetical protein